MMQYQLDDEKSSYKLMKEGEMNPLGLVLTKKRKTKDKKTDDDNKKQKPDTKKTAKQDRLDIEKHKLEAKKLLSDETHTAGAPS